MSETKSALWVEITATRGSAPRDAGTAMKVTPACTEGTIGGGALEYRAIATARSILAAGAGERSETIPLGPGLGQCCGGSVTLRYSYTPRTTDQTDAFRPLMTEPGKSPPQHLWLWGAGHVGRAVVTLAAPQRFEITWVDTAADRFPADVRPDINVIPTADMPLLAARAPLSAHHLIFTYSHEIDLALCAALLKRGAASIGLIGSQTKWTRFSKRLRAAGLDPSPITCPIGDKSLGKHPSAIALGVLRGYLCAAPIKASA